MNDKMVWFVWIITHHVIFYLSIYLDEDDYQLATEVLGMNYKANIVVRGPKNPFRQVFPTA